MVPFAARAPVARARRTAFRVALAVTLLAPLAPPLAGQITQIRPPTQLQPNPLSPEARLSLGDLVITAVTVTDLLASTPRTVASVTVQNSGSVPVTFPAGSVLVRAQAAERGGFTFPTMTTPVEYTFAAGESKTLTLSGDPCSGARPSQITFTVDPANAVPESNETNNGFTVSNVAPFATGDLQPTFVALHSTSPNYGTSKDANVTPAGYAAWLDVGMRNVGSGPALLCPAATMFRETQSPLSAKYGLRSVPVGGNVRIIGAGVLMIASLQNAYAAGDLPPGGYTWAVEVNPDRRMPEANFGNNAASSSVNIR